MCIDFQAIIDLLIHEEVRFNIRKRMKQYKKQANEGCHNLVFLPWRLDLVTHEERKVFLCKGV